MAKRNSHSFNKFQKELKKKAKEKMARRQGKKDQETEDDRTEAAEGKMKRLLVWRNMRKQTGFIRHPSLKCPSLESRPRDE